MKRESRRVAVCSFGTTSKQVKLDIYIIIAVVIISNPVKDDGVNFMVHSMYIAH